MIKKVTIWPKCATKVIVSLDSHTGSRANIAIQCQYDLEAHLDHIITSTSKYLITVEH